MIQISDKAGLYRATVSVGDVFIKNFDKIDHPKYFIVAGISGDRINLCAVYINSNIPDFIYSNKKLLKLQVNIKGRKYDFLRHDSFVSCNTQIKASIDKLISDCKYLGKIDEEDLGNIRQTIINSNLLTKNELKLYFQQ
ncbi:MAG: hypothetical protein LBM08_09865 [Dysgonamonadaceae bacterium]|jgi:hypothetical protein|nr:hypothetical protein [Dysgonamonadaceae bacterium]